AGQLLAQGFQLVGGTRQRTRRLQHPEPDCRRVARLHQDGPLHGALHGRRLLFTGDGGSDDFRGFAESWRESGWTSEKNHH
ncbi:hypothetical protein JOB18_001187, partial [Solea senegalensis]